MRLFQLLRGTLSATFQIGRALLPIAADDPTERNHLVTKGFADAAYGPDGRLREIQVDLGRKGGTSEALLPAGASVCSVDVALSEPYPAGATVQIGVEGKPDAFVKAGNLNLTETGLVQSISQRTRVETASPVRVSVRGRPASGDGIAIVTFSQPLR